MNKSEKIQLALSSLIVVLGILFMIDAGNTDLMFFLWLPHIWWVVLMTKLFTIKFPDKKKIVGASLTVIIGLALYFGSLFLLIPAILRLFGVVF